MRRISLLAGMLLVPALLRAQATPTADSSAIPAAIRATERWLQLLDAGSYPASWDSAAPAFQNAVTKAAWETAVRQARGPFEPLGGRALLSATWRDSLPGSPPGEYVIIQYRTGASGGRHVVETVVPMKTGAGWKVSGYFVRGE